MVAELEKQNAKSIEAQPEAASAWKQGIADVENMTLLPQTSSWWNAANVPGKKVEGMTYIMGIDMYEKQCRDTIDGWKGFNVVTAAA